MFGCVSINADMTRCSNQQSKWWRGRIMEREARRVYQDSEENHQRMCLRMSGINGVFGPVRDSEFWPRRLSTPARGHLHLNNPLIDLHFMFYY